jgi:hypothetical protein
VRTNPVGRESYYELREPLMRLCVEVKKHRDEPIRLVVELLRSWYTSEELQKKLDTLPREVAGPRSEREHILAAMSQYQRAEVLVSLSNPNKTDQAVLRLIQRDDSDIDQDTQVVSETIKRMAYLVSRRKRRGDNLAFLTEDLVQSAWVKLLTDINAGEYTDQQIKNPSGYLYQLVNEASQEEARKQRGFAGKTLSFYDEYFDRSRSAEYPEYLFVRDDRPDPDQVLELRARLLHYTQNYLLEVSDNSRKLKKRLRELLEAVVGSGAEDVLSEALIRSFILLAQDKDQDAVLQQLEKWYSQANQILGSNIEFELALRVLGTIIRYVNTKDKRILLELRLEERAFLEPLLVDDESQPEQRLRDGTH